MLKEHRQILKKAFFGVLMVMISGLAAYVVTPDTETGKIIRFLTPLCVGILVGAQIYMQELRKINDKLED